MSNYNVNYGHTLSGADTGTDGINGLLEQVLTRETGKEVVRLLKLMGHNVNEAYVDYAASLEESLNKQVGQCNNFNADLNIVIHFNSFYGKGFGSEIYTYKGKYVDEADRVLKELESLGFYNRGIKSSNLALINRTIAKTIYIEVCFIDNQGDYNLLNKYGIEGIAKAIVKGVTGELPKEENKTIEQLKNTGYDHSIPSGDNIFKIGKFAYAEETSDGRLIIHKDRANYITIGQGFIDAYWNDGKGNKGSKRLNE